MTPYEKERYDNFERWARGKKEVEEWHRTKNADGSLDAGWHGRWNWISHEDATFLAACGIKWTP